MKTNVLVYVVLLFTYLFLVQAAKAENIHFNNDVYILKSSSYSDINKGYENEYFPNNDKKSDWVKMIGIYYYPNVKDVIKFSNDSDKKIEEKDNVVLLKYIVNKKQNKAVLSFLENGEVNGKNYFEHDIYKYEPHPNKGMMVLRYSKRFFFNTNEEITKIGHEVKAINDDLIEQIIISPIPQIVEQDII